MGRSDKVLQLAEKLLVCAALTSCASEGVADSCGRLYCTIPNFIARSPLYSAHDGVHEYSIAPYIPSADPASSDSDPLLAATVKWELDPAFVAQAEFPYRPAAIKLTTKRAGLTIIKFTGKTLSGVSVQGKAQLTISEANADEWELGNERFHAGVTGAWSYADAAPGESPCGLPSSVAFPSVSPCAGCHDDASNTSADHTPIHAEGYSDSDLNNIVITGVKPAGSPHESLALRSLPMPDCVFREFHAWNLTRSELQGMLWKVRSIPPSVE